MNEQYTYPIQAWFAYNSGSVDFKKGFEDANSDMPLDSMMPDDYINGYNRERELRRMK